MSAVRAINDLTRRMGDERAGEFAQYCGLLLRSKGDLALAQRMAGNASERVQATLKAAVAVGSTDPSNWAASLHQYSQLSDGFIASLQGISCYDSLLPAMRKVPMRVRVAVVTTAAIASATNEAAIKPLTTMAFDTAQLVPQKAIAVTVLNDELVRVSAPNAEALISVELRTAVAKAVDSIFLAALYASVSPIASSGTTTAAICNDLSNMLDAVDPKATSRLFLVLPPRAARAMALSRDAGGPPFPQMTVNGGEVAGISVLTSDQMPTSGNSPSEDRALLIDASGIIAGGDGDQIAVDVARHASLALDTSPDSPETSTTNLVSLWQHNRIALKAERLFGFDIGRATAVAALHSIAWG
jgi:hypothetical protein